MPAAATNVRYRALTGRGQAMLSCRRLTKAVIGRTILL